MELVVETENEGQLPGHHKFAKMLVGAVVGFVASGLAEKLYDAVLERRQNKVPLELDK